MTTTVTRSKGGGETNALTTASLEERCVTSQVIMSNCFLLHHAIVTQDIVFPCNDFKCYFSNVLGFSCQIFLFTFAHTLSSKHQQMGVGIVSCHYINVNSVLLMSIVFVFL